MIKASKKEIPKLKRKLTKIFNEFIRVRDQKLQGGKCISCNNIGTQAGHYFSTSQCPQPSMVFCEKNVSLQCSHCNCWLHGNIQDYSVGLNKKWGYNVVEELAVKRSFKQNPWTRFEYEAMIQEYTRKLAELKGQLKMKPAEVHHEEMPKNKSRSAINGTTLVERQRCVRPRDGKKNA